jgi:hypothetical protein
MEAGLRYGYVKFVSDEFDSPTYVLVCIEAMKKYFDEFKTIDEMIPELTMEYYNNFMIINCLPMKMLQSFKILVRFATIREIIYLNDIDEEINLLLLLCRLANNEQIKIFLDQLDIRCDVWIRLTNENFDAINFLDEEQRMNICISIAKKYPESDKTTYLSFYGIPYFENLPDYGIDPKPFTSYKNLCAHGFPQIRIHDRQSKSYYQTFIIGSKVLLFNPCGYQLVTKKTKPLNMSDHFFSSESSSDDENESDPNTQIIKLPKEKIEGSQINSYVVNVVDVYFSNKIIPMQMVESTRLNRIYIFHKKYMSDYDKLQLNKDKYLHVYKSESCAAAIAFRQNHIYVPPTRTKFESLLEDMKNEEPVCSPADTQKQDFSSDEYLYKCDEIYLSDGEPVCSFTHAPKLNFLSDESLFSSD